MKTSQWLVIAFACIAAFAFRFTGLMPNFGCLVTLALVSGVAFRNRYGLLVPLGIRFLSDCVIEWQTGWGFYSSMWFDYAAYALIYLLGCSAVHYKKFDTVVAGGLLGVAAFFLISNGGVWWMGSFYAPTPAGLTTCLVNGVPFVRGTLVGNLIALPMVFAAWYFVTEATANSVSSTVSPSTDSLS